jgi:hypothetical protein
MKDKLEKYSFYLIHKLYTQLRATNRAPRAIKQVESGKSYWIWKPPEYRQSSKSGSAGQVSTHRTEFKRGEKTKRRCSYSKDGMGAWENDRELGIPSQC